VPPQDQLQPFPRIPALLQRDRYYFLQLITGIVIRAESI